MNFLCDLCDLCGQSTAVFRVKEVAAIVRKIEDEVNALPMPEVERRLAALPAYWQPDVARTKGEADRRALLVDLLFLESGPS
jgi:hypothetical protein